MATADDRRYQDMFDELSTTHPDYQRQADAWMLYRDVLGDYGADPARFLVKGHFETKEIFDLRKRLTEFVPDSVLCVQKIIGALFKRPPTLELGSQQAILGKFTEDIDRKGHPIEDERRRWAHFILGYGTTRILVNRTYPQDLSALVKNGRLRLNADQQRQIDEGTRPKLTSEQEKKAGIRPFVVSYSPLSVLDWNIGDDGRLDLVRIKETRFQRSEFGRRWHAEVTTFIEYDRANVRYWRFVKDEKSGKLLGMIDPVEQEHGLGLVPMVVRCFPEEVAPMVGSGYLHFSARADVRKMRAESDLHYDAYVHAHPLFYAKIRDELAKRGVGANIFIKLRPNTDEECGYVQMPTSASEILHKLVDLNRTLTAQHAGMDPLGQITPGTAHFQATGIARAYSFDTSEGRILTQAADELEHAEREVLEIAARYETSTEAAPEDSVFTGTCQYPDTFDTAALGDLIDTTAKVGSTQVNSPKGIKLLHKRMMTQLLGELNPKELKEVLEEIEKNPLINTTIGRTKPVSGNIDWAAPDDMEDGDEPPDEETDDEETVGAGAGKGGKKAPPPPPRKGLARSARG